MRILSITAQKPFSTGSGIYLTELVRVFHEMVMSQAVVAGIYPGELSPFPSDISFYPVYFKTPELPFPIPGMSDEMPYESTRYCDMTEDMVDLYRTEFLGRIDQAVEEFQPDLIICHHLYLLTPLVRDRYPDKRVYGFCHNTDLRQMDKHNLMRSFIIENIRRLDRIFAPQKAQADGIVRIYGVPYESITQVGVGYNKDIFYAPEAKADDGVTHLFFAGKIAEKKGVMSLMKALKLVKAPVGSIELSLAGGAGNQEEYDSIVELSGDQPHKVTFLGKLNQAQMAEAYRRADVFVLPSFYDAIPLTTIEALASGDRLVVSELPGIREFYGRHVKGASIRYVPLPAMRNSDEPEVSELPDFERHLAEAIDGSVSDNHAGQADVSDLTWRAIAEEVLSGRA